MLTGADHGALRSVAAGADRRRPRRSTAFVGVLDDDGRVHEPLEAPADTWPVALATDGGAWIVASTGFVHRQGGASDGRLPLGFRTQAMWTTSAHHVVLLGRDGQVLLARPDGPVAPVSG